jgi:hypothetical protein
VDAALRAEWVSEGWEQIGYLSVGLDYEKTLAALLVEGQRHRFADEHVMPYALHILYSPQDTTRIRPRPCRQTLYTSKHLRESDAYLFVAYCVCMRPLRGQNW